MPLGKDLAAIRAQQKLSVEDIHDATRIPFSTIQEIEAETIFYDDNRNTTYMRSFVRTYAKALKINDEDAVQALDQMADDTYRGIILKKYGDENTPQKPASSKAETESSSKSSPKPSSSEPKKSTSASDKKSLDQKSVSKKEKSETILSSDKKSTAAEEKTSETPEKTRYAGKTKTTVPPSSRKTANTSEAPDVKSINWADTGRKMYTFRDNKKYIYGSIVALLIVIIAGYLLFRDSDDPMTETEIATENLPEEEGILPETPIDTAETVTIPSNPNQLSPDAADIDSAQAEEMLDNSPVQAPSQPEVTRSGALPDTLMLIVYAVNDKLEPVRVKSDLVDGYSPYWIEQGVAMRFEFTSEIHVRGQYTRMEMFVNGNYMENFRDYRGDENQIHITRELLEEDSQLWLPRELSTEDTDITLPDTVINRPIFF
jgi:hypothetical protein